MNTPSQTAERHYELPALALAFLAGCLIATSLETGAWLWLLFGCGVFLALALRTLGKRALIAVMLCALALGAMRAQASLSPVQPAPGTFEITGNVFGEADLRDDGRLTFTLANVTLDGFQQEGRAYCSFYLNGENAPDLFDGAALRFEGRVYLPDGKSGEPHMDFRLWLLQNGMTYGIASSKPLTVENAPGNAPCMDGASRVRASFRESLVRVMGDDARLVMAMLFGEREGLTEDENEAFQALGIAHVMAVSGLHVGLLGGMLVALLSALRLRRSCQLPIVLVFLAAYCALTGFSAASVRAAVMLMLYLTSRVLGRRTDPLVVLSSAMLIVLLLNPLQAYSAGFVLSFSAVAGITLLNPVLLHLLSRICPPREHTLTPHAPVPKRLAVALLRYLGKPRELICLSLSAQLGVLLPTAIYFHRLPLYGVFINLLIIPYMGFLVPVYAFSLLLSPIPIMGNLMGALSAQMSQWLLYAVKLLSTLPNASVRVAAAPVAIAFGAALIMLCISRRIRAGVMRRWIAVGLVAALAVCGATLTRPSSLRYIQLAVGQADAALVFDGDKTLMIDAGDNDMAAVDYLLDEGRDVDALFLSHLHLDHAAGVGVLLDNGISIGHVYLPVNAGKQRLSEESLAIVDLLHSKNIPITELAAGDNLRYNEVSVSVQWPSRTRARINQDANDLPLVLSLDFGGYVIASMSDLGSDYEGYAAVPCDVLKVGHHGSSSSTSDVFLDFSSPQAALISCSSGSKALPDADTLARLTGRGINVYRTDVCGDIVITIKDGQLLLTPYKARLSE